MASLLFRWRERIDHSVHGFFCTLDNAVPDILGCLRSAIRHVGCSVHGSRVNAAHGDGDRENDRKECFHGTNVSFLPAPLRLSTAVTGRKHFDRNCGGVSTRNVLWGHLQHQRDVSSKTKGLETPFFRSDTIVSFHRGSEPFPLQKPISTVAL